MTIDMIRCHDCGSIDPSLYSGRILCCVVEVPASKALPGTQLIMWNTKRGFGPDR